MDEAKYIDDLKEIKDIMSRSTRFISLSGLAGVSTGLIALVGAYFAYQTVYTNQDYQGYQRTFLTDENLFNLFAIAILTLLLSIVVGVFFTTQKARKNHQNIWDLQSKRLLVNLIIPLLSGGILCTMLLSKGYIGLVAPLTLIFYGLALVNASKYTLSEIRSLGIIEIILGLISFQFIGYGLLFWSVGFGVLHIIYGIIMHVRYGS